MLSDPFLKINLALLVFSAVPLYFAWRCSFRDIVSRKNMRELREIFGGEFPDEVQAALAASPQRMRAKKRIFIPYLALIPVLLVFTFLFHTEKNMYSLWEARRAPATGQRIGGPVDPSPVIPEIDDGIRSFDDLIRYSALISAILIFGGAIVVILLTARLNYRCPWTKWFYRTYANDQVVWTKLHSLLVQFGFRWSGDRRVFLYRARVGPVRMWFPLTEKNHIEWKWL